MEEAGVTLSEEDTAMMRWKIADIVKQENDAYVPYVEELEGENENDPFEDDEEDGRLSCKARDDIYDLY